MHRLITRTPLTDGDALVKAAHDLSDALGRKQNWLGEERMRDINRLSRIYRKIVKEKSNANGQEGKLANKDTHPNF